MSRTANGWIKSAASGTRFVADFLIDGLQYTFTGNLSPSVQHFEANNTILTYNNVGQLTATRTFHGRIGVQDIILNIANTPRIEGRLDRPIHPASSVSGTGVWHQF